MAGYITVLLQKSDPAGDWGIRMGPLDQASVVITQIDEGCVAGELLEPGDRIIEIEGMETTKLSIEELQGLLGNPSKRLSMVVLKKNLPKGNCTVRKTTTQEVSTVEETREEIERKKEYEVLLEVSPRHSLADVVKTIREKIERGEKLSAMEMQITSSLKTSTQQSTSTTDSTSSKIERDFESSKLLEMLNKPQNTEVLKRKQKFLQEQKKEEMIKSEKMKLEKLDMEEKKKKSSTFWTDPPSDLKNAIKKNQVWKPNESNEPITTSAIFSQLNDLHNTLRKGSARDEKRQFWENCRKKYGWDPPGSKYNVSHRVDTSNRDDITRSRSCEPEHLDSQNPFKKDDYRQSDPFFTPSPTNPFYAECSSRSEESLLGSKGELSKCSKPLQPFDVQSEKPKKKYEGGKTEALIVACGEKVEHANEAYREDFTSKCEFFERATSVPTTSCVKNAQDLVSERLGPTQKSPLKKPSDFINEIQAENKRTTLRRSISKEETRNENPNVPPVVPERARSSSLPEPANNISQANGSNLSEHKAFLGQSVLRQFASGLTSTSSEKKEVVLARENVSKSQKISLHEQAKNDIPQTTVDSSENFEKKEFVMTQENITESEHLSLQEQTQKDFHSKTTESTGILEGSQKIEKKEERQQERPVSQAVSMESEIKNHPIVIAAQRRESLQESNNEAKSLHQENITQAFKLENESSREINVRTSENKSGFQITKPINKTAQEIEAQMKESINRIRTESEKLCSLDLRRDFPQTFYIGNEASQNMIPDSTGFPGLTDSAEFQKRSFVETSYEKVTRTGTPYENVESAWKREFRVATPSGFYENLGQEEVFRQESRTEGLRRAELARVEETEITRAGAEYSCAYTSEGTKSGSSQSGSDIQPETK